MKVSFEWDEKKNIQNVVKHKIDFAEAQKAFLDAARVIAEDLDHSDLEKRYYCIGRIKGGIVTVRFTYRDRRIRIIGAGFWRKGKRAYEKSKLHE